MLHCSHWISLNPVQSKLSKSTLKQRQGQTEESDSLTSGDDPVDLPYTLRSKRSKVDCLSLLRFCTPSLLRRIAVLQCVAEGGRDFFLFHECNVDASRVQYGQ